MALNLTNRDILIQLQGSNRLLLNLEVQLYRIDFTNPAENS
jgi:hypothetical protein